VRLMEERMGQAPRRRTELLAQRRRELRKTMKVRLDWLASQLKKQGAIQARLEGLAEKMTRLQDQVTTLEAIYRARAREEKPHSQLAKARCQLAAAQQKLEKAPLQLQQAQRAVATHKERLAGLQAEYEELTTQLAQLEADNKNNSDPVTIILRLDAGFGSGSNLTWLIEMGYWVYTKAFNGWLPGESS